MSHAEESVPELEPTELRDRLARGDSLLLLDVREPFELSIADLPDHEKLHIPVRQLESRIHEVDPDREIVVYCRSGGRSARAVERLRSEGLDRVWNLRGGLLKWREDVDPSIRAY